MSDERNFLDRRVTGETGLADTDDFIDRWHAAPEDQELHDYLGMTKQEYAQWLRRPDVLPDIIRTRRHMKPRRPIRRTATSASVSYAADAHPSLFPTPPTPTPSLP